jgi:isocitrate dehydrogenase (NAD+)
MKTVTLIPGDGTGPELTAAMRRVVDASGVKLAWEVVEAGEASTAKGGDPLPPDAIASIRKNRVAIKGPLSTPIGSGYRSVNVALRKEFDLYAGIRPCKSMEGVRTPFKDVDLVLVRENTEDLYAGPRSRSASSRGRAAGGSPTRPSSTRR